MDPSCDQFDGASYAQKIYNALRERSIPVGEMGVFIKDDCADEANAFYIGVNSWQQADKAVEVLASEMAADEIGTVFGIAMHGDLCPGALIPE